MGMLPAIHGEAQQLFGDALQHHVAGRLDLAVSQYQLALGKDPNLADAHNNLAVALVTQGRVDAAAVHFEKALSLQPDSAEGHNNLANWLATQGRMEKASEHFGRAIAIRPDYAEAHFNRAEIRTFQMGDAELAELQRLAARADLPVTALPYVHFALGKALEDTKDFGRAFEHLRFGNEAKRRQIPYDEAGADAIFRQTAAVFNEALFARLGGAGHRSEMPIFVLGMPRSGSTLVEQILANHPQVHAAGELADFDQSMGATLSTSMDALALGLLGRMYVGRLEAMSGGKARVVDKLPGNFLNIGWIRLALPNARIIHTTRDPIDTCLSCYSKLFTASQYFSYDLGELGRHYRRYSALMSHWRSVLPEGSMLDVAYEDVVDDLEGQARRLVAYCGLPWDDRCLDFHTAKRAVVTASAAQARQPLYRTSVQRWRRYEAELAPLLAALQ
jgi:tetratricopeptide (TPR) repeat protein